MILIKDTQTDEQFELVSVYLAARPYHEGYVRVVPYPNEYDIDPWVESSTKFVATYARPMNGDFCREHDMDRLTLSLAGIEFN